MVRTVNRHELTDAQWHVVEPLLPRPHHMGRPPRDAREMLDAMLWLVRVGAPWRDLPDWYGPWQTVYHYFNEWRHQGVLEEIAARLLLELDAGGPIEWDLWCVDRTAVRASKAAAGAGKKGARKSLTTTR